MPQFPVLSYALQVITTPVQQPGASPVPFRVAVAIQLQPNGPFSFLPVNAPDEFIAILALLQTPGKLMFDPVGSILEKLGP
jgi:hypothetical protein